MIKLCDYYKDTVEYDSYIFPSPYWELEMGRLIHHPLTDKKYPDNIFDYKTNLPREHFRFLNEYNII